MRDGLFEAGYKSDNSTLSKWVLPGGQSGDPLSSLYDSLLPRWADGSYVSMDRAMATRDEVTLSPA